MAADTRSCPSATRLSSAHHSGTPLGMTQATNGRMPGAVRIAAAGDVHCHEGNREAMRRAFAGLDGRTDLVLLAGDPTTPGEPGQAAGLAAASRQLSGPGFS